MQRQFLLQSQSSLKSGRPIRFRFYLALFDIVQILIRVLPILFQMDMQDNYLFSDSSVSVNFTTINVSYDNVTIASMTKGSSPLKLAFDVVIKITLIVIMLGMGCTIEIDPLLKHLRRPTGIAIGMVSQFIVLPLVTFGLAHALQLDAIAALGMLVMGSCPGGSTSNIFSYWVDGDVPLR